MKKYPSYLFLILLLGILSCEGDSSVSSEKDLQAYVLEEDHGLIKSEQFGNTNISVTYRPTDLLVSQELGNEISEEQIKELRNKYGNYHYFILGLSSGDKEVLYGGGLDYGRFSDLVQQLSFRMGSYVNLTTSTQDTIPLADYVFPRTYGIGSETNLLMVFNAEKTKNTDWLQFNLNEFGMGLGNQRFRFRKEDLENIPTIDFNKSYNKR
ncbi:MAG: hypothetical protein AAF363_20140 [Bacteroidota bacterium]